MSQKDLHTVSTPCLILDIARVRSNAAKVLSIAETHNVSLRPHIKTHKSPDVGLIQCGGKTGPVTTSTLEEVRAFARRGFDEFTYAVPIEPGKFEEAIRIIKTGVSHNLLTDNPTVPPKLDAAARRAGISINLFLKVDCGYHRCGIDPEAENAFEIPRLIEAASNLTFGGILTHAGHSYHAHSLEEIREIAASERDMMVEFSDRLAKDGIETPVVSIGSTPTISHAENLDGVDEIRPGNYIFFDAFQATLGSCGFEDCALTVLSSVVHKSTTNKKIVIDAGGIALSKDRGAVDIDKDCGYGRVLDLEGGETGLRLNSLSQEHGEIEVLEMSLFEKLKVGDRVRILANHSCLTAAQYDFYNIFENGEIVDRWEIARGW